MAQDPSTEVTVIIPTTGSEKRRASLLNAIECVFSQTGIGARPLVIINGKTYSRRLFEMLQSRKELDVIYTESASAPAAVRVGVERVRTPFFACLDDDDILLPHALSVRIQPMHSDSGIDVVVTNGFRDTNGHRQLVHSSMDPFRQSAIEALTTRNWLSSCAGLFRRSSITPYFFDPKIQYFEWTYIAYKLALNARLSFLEDPTYVIRSTPQSLSMSVDYMCYEPVILRKILELNLPNSIQNYVQTNLSSSLHSLADYHRKNHMYWQAWQYHIRSTLLPGGRRYLAYTRKLFLPGLFN